MIRYAFQERCVDVNEIVENIILRIHIRTVCINFQETEDKNLQNGVDSRVFKKHVYATIFEKTVKLSELLPSKQF